MIVVISSAPLSWEEEELIGKASALPGVLSEEETAGVSSSGGIRESLLDVGRQCSFQHTGLTGVLQGNLVDTSFDCFKLGLCPLWTAKTLH